MGLLSGLNGLQDLAATNTTVADDASKLIDTAGLTALKVYCAMHPKDLRCKQLLQQQQQPNQDQKPDGGGTNWLPYIIGGVAVIGIGAVLYSRRKKRPKKRR